MEHAATLGRSIMDLSSGVSLGQLLLALGVLLATGGMAWGAITQRVKSLEREVETLSGLAERLTRIEEKTTYIGTEIGKLTTSWLFREPPKYAEIERSLPRPRGSR